jgi:hypothetical protein
MSFTRDYNRADCRETASSFSRGTSHGEPIKDGFNLKMQVTALNRNSRHRDISHLSDFRSAQKQMQPVSVPAIFPNCGTLRSHKFQTHHSRTMAVIDLSGIKAPFGCKKIKKLYCPRKTGSRTRNSLSGIFLLN